ncbi:hypothetical protein SAMN06295888_1181 [Desulfonatronum zhilinae]|nr:hypothetical protein SAMN06295888_1181 [Desulfonatronum zhilinae]
MVNSFRMTLEEIGTKLLPGYGALLKSITDMFAGFGSMTPR